MPSSNQGQLTPFVPPTTNRGQHNFVSTHHENKKTLLEDLYAEEECKTLIISIIEKVYLEALRNKRFGYKVKTLRDFVDLLINNYQATPEERVIVKVLIEQAWDPNEHMIKLFSRLKKQLTILAKMKDGIPYPEEDFVEALYMTVQKKTKQFPKA